MDDCMYCFQDINAHQDFHSWIHQNNMLCGSCKQQLEYIDTTRKIEDLSVHILYVYNQFLEGMIFQYKEGRDIALKQVFFHEHIKAIEKQYKGYTLLLMPSSQEKTKERGFHALRGMLEEIHLEKLEPFYKSENRKQSRQNYEQRQHIDDIMRLDPSVKLPKKKLLLIDDVCTTGSTLKSAYHLLAEHTLSIEALVLCANPLFVEEKNRINKCRMPQLWIHK